MTTAKSWARWSALVAALVLLNLSLTFQSAWPTPAIRWRNALSIELAALVLALAWFGRPSRRVLGWLGVVWILLVIGHYADVTAPALYGRDINVYWDLRFVPDVVAMMTRVAPLWLVVVVTAAALLALGALYALLRWAMATVGDAVARPGERRALAAAAAVIAVVFVGHSFTAHDPEASAFSRPVTGMYARQARLMTQTLGRSSSLAAGPSMNSDLSLVQGADVFLVFVEAYGAVSYERQEFAEGLAASRVRLAADIRDTHRDVVSAYVESPTFGGSSWLAHLSLVSGIEVRDTATSSLLMTQERDTLVTTFARRGFRTVALIPGLRQSWPEGVFYGFDDVYGAGRLDYKGPEFGWFAIPDQFAIEKLDALEVGRRPRRPLFVFFPTLSSHFPFSPTPPYQPDWPRLLTDLPYDDTDTMNAYSVQPDWLNFGPGYIDALRYGYASIGGYLRRRPDRDFVMILVGDHQPVAAVSGEGAPWTVPVHVIASRRPLLDRLTALGFRPGLGPERPAMGAMHDLTPILLDAFGNYEPAE